DLKLFQQEGGWDVVQAITQYWCSRVVWNCEEENYHIVGKRVSIPNPEDITVRPIEELLGSKMCYAPDEYHCTVDNSVYTNAVAGGDFVITSLSVGAREHVPSVGQLRIREFQIWKGPL
ncbi:hypothetical protein E2320_020872, partial [Naja naja]